MHKALFLEMSVVRPLEIVKHFKEYACTSVKKCFENYQAFIKKQQQQKNKTVIYKKEKEQHPQKRLVNIDVKCFLLLYH